jgi:hypothetical protein
MVRLRVPFRQPCRMDNSNTSQVDRQAAGGADGRSIVIELTGVTRSTVRR